MPEAVSQRVVESEVPPEGEGVRLDAWLAGRFNYRSRARWQQSLREGEILLNGAPARASRVLKAGERVRFVPKDLSEPDVCRDFALLADFGRYFAIDKPGNLPCHPSGRYFKNTLWALLKERFGEVRIVNRLDRETSGVVLVARDSEAAAKLSAIVAGHKAVKTYVALVHGSFPKGETLAKGFLFRDLKSEVRKKRAFAKELPPSAEDAESASTLFRLLGSAEGFSEVEAKPETGRLHQIRATLLSLGFPLVGDKLYGLDDAFYLRQCGGSLSDADRKALLLPRQALHAAKLEFACPFSGVQVALESPPPKEFEALHRRCAGV